MYIFRNISTCLRIFVFVFLLSCCTNEPNSPIDENPILGRWSESFTWTDFTDCITVGEETNCATYSETSTIEFSDNNFSVKILPPHRIYIVEEDTMYLSWSSDTLYAGTFVIADDTIGIFLNNNSEYHNFYYWIENDSLHLAAMGIPNDTGIYPFIIESFLWGYAWGKTFGTFCKLE